MRIGWRPLLFVAVIAALIAVGVAASRYQTIMRTKNAGGEARDYTSALVGQRAPAFALPAVGGGSVSLDQFRGKMVLLTFWSSF